MLIFMCLTAFVSGALYAFLYVCVCIFVSLCVYVSVSRPFSVSMDEPSPCFPVTATVPPRCVIIPFGQCLPIHVGMTLLRVCVHTLEEVSAYVTTVFFVTMYSSLDYPRE